MNIKQELKDLFYSRTRVVNIISYEETRIVKDLLDIFDSQEGVYSWDLADNFVCHRKSSPPFDVSQLVNDNTVLNLIDEFNGSAAFILKDFHFVWGTKKTFIRKLRNLAFKLSRLKDVNKNIVIITPEHNLPHELKQDVVCIDYPKPDKDVMTEFLKELITVKHFNAIHPPGLRKKIIEAALGLSSVQAERVFRQAVYKHGASTLTAECIPLIIEEKKRIIRESGALEFYSLSELTEKIGGLENLKNWLRLRKQAFSQEAKDYGLDAPKGLGLIGIPGTGKSLCARVTASEWELPLLRLDMGAIYGGIVGASEKNLREAIHIAEVISPCILWVDEVEKAFAGLGSFGDSGVSSRLMGYFLTWLQEKKNPVFVFATANDIKKLPPEFFRKERFDEVFFLDLPTLKEREEILQVHLERKDYNMVSQRFNLNQVAQAAEGFVGAELEAVVKGAMFPAFMEGGRELTTEDLLKSVGGMVPLAKSQAEKIQKLRELLLNGQALNASKTQPAEAVNPQVIRGSRFIEP